jgi:dolichol-phosphate mannosyltransferase
LKGYVKNLISVLIPTLNEEQNIKTTLKRVEMLFSNIKKSFEIIIIDEKSSDKTIQIIKKCKKKNVKIIISKKKLGLGYALDQGLAKAKGELILFLDADNSVENKYLSKIITASAPNRLVIGSRYVKNSKIFHVSFIKSFLSKLLNKFVSRVFNLNVNDCSHSLRIFPKKFSYKVKNYNHPIFFWEHTIEAKKKGFNIIEIPVHFYERNKGKSKNSFFKMLKNVVMSFNNILVLKLNN